MGKRQFTPEYKAKIVMEVLREESHISEIAAREGIHQTQLQTWKKDWLKKNLPKYSELIGKQNLVSKDDPLSVKRQCELGIYAVYPKPNLSKRD